MGEKSSRKFSSCSPADWPVRVLASESGVRKELAVVREGKGGVTSIQKSKSVTRSVYDSVLVEVLLLW